MKSLRNSFITPQRATELFHYSGDVIRLHKERRIHAKRKKLHEKIKICTKRMSQPIKIKLFIKNIEKLRLHLIKVKRIVNQMTPIIEILWKENRNLQKRGEYAKITNVLWKLVVQSKKTIWGKQNRYEEQILFH